MENWRLCIIAIIASILLSITDAAQAQSDRDALITIHSVQQLGCFEGRRIGGRCRGSPDFYPILRVYGDDLPSPPPIIDEASITPDWTFRVPVDISQANMPINIRIMDEDGALRFDDDTADINTDPAVNDLTFVLDWDTCTLSGNVSGICTEIFISSGTGEHGTTVEFSVDIEAGAIVPPTSLGDAGLSVICLADKFYHPAVSPFSFGVTAEAVTALKGPATFPADEIEIRIAYNDSVYTNVCSSTAICQLTTPNLTVEDGDQISYACHVRHPDPSGSGVREAFSGWRATQVGLPNVIDVVQAVGRPSPIEELPEDPPPPDDGLTEVTYSQIAPLPVLITDDPERAIDIVFFKDVYYYDLFSSSITERPSFDESIFDVFASDIHDLMRLGMYNRQKGLQFQKNINVWLAFDIGTVGPEPLGREFVSNCGVLLTPDDTPGDINVSIGDIDDFWERSAYENARSSIYSFADARVVASSRGFQRDCANGGRFSINNTVVFRSLNRRAHSSFSGTELRGRSAEQCRRYCAENPVLCETFQYKRSDRICEVSTGNLYPTGLSLENLTMDDDYIVGQNYGISHGGTFVHEFMHTAIGLQDEYCCDSNYRELDFLPNIFESQSRCINDPGPNQPNSCLQIQRVTDATATPVAIETIEYWRKDWNADDIMLRSGETRATDDRRIEYIFEQCRSGRC